MYMYFKHVNHAFYLHSVKGRNCKTVILLQIDGRLSIEALVLFLHVGEAREVVWIDERKVHLKTPRDTTTC